MRKVITALWVTLAVLVAFGLVLVYSASVTQKGGALPFVKMQCAAAFIGLLAAIVLGRIDYRVLQKRRVIIPLAVLSVALSALVFLGPEINGSRRWIRLAGFSLQPSEFARIGMILAMAAWYGRVGFKSRTCVKGFLCPLAILVVMLAPVAASPDLGASVVICISCGTVLFAAGVKWRYLVLAGLAAVVLGGAFIMSSPNRRSRMMTYVSNVKGEESTEDTAYHRNQSLESFVRGGALGAGLGNSIQKHNFLPEANTDFIFSIAGEEFGLPGTLGVVVVFMIMLWCGVYVAYHACDRFGRLAALGLTVLLVFEAGFNIGMVTGCLPTKGLALPFVSYGGTSIAASFIAFGLIVSIGNTSANTEIAPMMRDAFQEF